MIGLNRKLIDDIACEPNMKNAECECHQQDREENISPGFPDSFIIEQQHHKYPKDYTTVD
jgi:hypothetical protein